MHCDRVTVLPFLSHHTSQYNSLYMYVYMYMYMYMSYHSYLGGLHFRLLSYSHARRSHAPDETRLIGKGQALRTRTMWLDEFS